VYCLSLSLSLSHTHTPTCLTKSTPPGIGSWIGITRLSDIICSVLQCVALCCSVLQCVTVCCSVLQCVTVCCSVLLVSEIYMICVHAFVHTHTTHAHAHKYTYARTQHTHTHIHTHTHTQTRKEAGWQILFSAKCVCVRACIHRARDMYIYRYRLLHMHLLQIIRKSSTRSKKISPKQ